MNFVGSLSYTSLPYTSLRHFFQMLNTAVFGLVPFEATAGFNMEDYDVDYATGFFPQEPLPRLSGHFELWENALDDAEGNLSLGEDTRDSAKARRPYGETWRERVRSFPLLDTDPLAEDDRIMKRAHMVLGFLINFYVHSQPPSDTSTLVHIPECLAVPIVKISRGLGIAPVLTFADTVLWNVKPADTQLPMSANNIATMHAFSNTAAERNFYVASARAELRGVEMLRIIEDYARLSGTSPGLHFASKTARDLRRLATVVQDLTDIIQGMKDFVDPHSFYWEVRPWLRGSSGGASRWIYDGVSDSDTLDLNGPSAGQSSVMHALDVFLDVDHKLAQKRSPAPSEENKRADKGFMERMRRYMPGSHQAYLRDLAALPVPVRSLTRTSPLLRESYDLTVLALKRFRDMHMRMACLYIISMANTLPPGTPEESSERRKMQPEGPAKGTGGNNVASLLKAGRDATNRTLLTRK